MKKLTMAAGGILAIATVIGGNEAVVHQERAAAVAEFHQPVSVEVAKRQTGEEIKSLRTETSETFKAAPKPDGTPMFRAKVYAGKHFWKDADCDSLRPLDLTVREISALARLNPLRTHDLYCDVGPYQARWFADTPGNFRMETGGLALEYRALYDPKGITVATEPTATGMKETLTLADKDAAHTLRWIVETDGSLVAQADNSFAVRAGDGSTPLSIAPPKAWDVAGKPVMAVASVEGDTLTFRVTVLPGQEYPVTVDPTTTVTGANDGRLFNSNADYPTARDAAAGSSVSMSTVAVGQRYINPNYAMYRGFASFALPVMASVSACTLFVDGNSDVSVTDFGVYLFTSTYSNPLAVGDFDLFNGHQASGVYNGTVLNDTWNSSSYSAGWNTIVFNAAGRDSVFAKNNNTFKIALISKEDYDNSTPTDEEYVIFSSSGGTPAPYLSFTYTPGPTAPSDFANTGATTTTLSFSWTDNSSDELGFKIKNAGGDTVTVGTYAAGATTGTVNGLSVNTRHGLRIFAYNTVYSTPSDSVVKYTLANPPVTWAFTQDPNDGTKILISFGTNSNPAGTQYAIRDSTRQKWVDSAGRADSTWRVWLTSAQWTTLAKMINCAPNNWERIGVVARNGDGVETAYLWGVVQPVATLAVTGSQAAVNDGGVLSTNAVYATARNADPYATTDADSVVFIGQGTSDYLTMRYFTGFVLSTSLNLVSASTCSLCVYVASEEVSAGDFEIDAVLSNQHGALAGAWAKNFYGWAASGAYNVAGYAYGSRNTSAISPPEWVKMPFSGTWADSLAAAIARSDTFRLTLLSYEDINNSQPAANEDISIRTSSAASPLRPYLSMTYTLKTPSGFVTRSASTTSIKCSWTDNITGETGFRIRNAVTGAYLDSTAANDTTKTVTGLSVNTLYDLQVQVIGGTADGSLSAADSCYTRAATPGKPTVTMVGTTSPNNAYRRFIFDVNGNPAYTRFAVRDTRTGKFVMWLTGAMDTLRTGTTDSSWVWRTYANWGGANGDTVAYPVGNTSVFEAYAKSGQ